MLGVLNTAGVAICLAPCGSTFEVEPGPAGGESNINPDNPAVDTVYHATPDPADGSLSWATAAHTLPGTLASQAVAYVNTKGIVLMGGDDTGMRGDTTEVVKGTVASAGNINWSDTALPTLDGPAPFKGNVSRNAGATFNHYAYSVAGLVRGHDSTGINCLLLP